METQHNEAKRSFPFLKNVVQHRGSVAISSQPYNAAKHHLTDTNEEMIISNTKRVKQDFGVPVFFKEDCKGQLSVLSRRIEPRKPPLLRKILSRGTGSTNGFALDHGRYPKLVGVQSIASGAHSKSPVRSLTQAAPRYISSTSEMRQSPISLEELNQSTQITNSPFILASAEPVTNSSLMSSRTTSPTSVKADLEWLHVAQDKVFLVRKCDLSGESFLIEVDNTGKRSILTKFRIPRGVTMGSPGDSKTTTPPGHKRPFNIPNDTNNALVSALRQQNQQLYHRPASFSSTKAPVAINPIQRNFSQMLPQLKTQSRAQLSEYLGLQLSSSELSGSLQSNGHCGDSALLNSYEGSKDQAPYDNTKIMADIPPDKMLTNSTLDLQRQRLLLKKNDILRENPELYQFRRSFPLPERVVLGKQKLSPKTGSNENPRPVNRISHDTLQSSATSYMEKLAAHEILNVSVQSLTGQKLLPNQIERSFFNGDKGVAGCQQNANTTARTSNGSRYYLRNETVNVNSKRKYTYTSPKRNYKYPQQKWRNQYKHLLMNCTPNQLPSSEQPSTVVFGSLTSNRVGSVNERQNFTDRANASESVRRCMQTGARVQVVPQSQRFAQNVTHCSNRNADSGVKINLQRQEDGRPRNPITEEPHASIGATKKVLKLIESLDRRLCSKTDSPQIRELLLGSASRGISVNQTTAQNSASKKAIDILISGKNGMSRETANVHAVDSSRSIYVDESDLVMSKELREEHSNQSLRNVLISSQSSAEGGWSQKCTLKTSRNPTFPGHEGQRLYSNESLQGPTSVNHKQYGPYRTLTDVVWRGSPRKMGPASSTSAQQRNNASKQAYGIRGGQDAEIVIDPVSEIDSRAQSSIYLNSENAPKETKIHGQKSDTLPPSKRTVQIHESYDNGDKDGVVEVIISEPKRQSPLRITFDSDNVHNITTKTGHEHFVKNKMAANLAMKPATSKTGKNVNLFNERNFLPEIIDEKYETLETNQQNSIKERKLQTSETNEVIKATTETFNNEGDFHYKTILNQEGTIEDDEAAFHSSANDYICCSVSAMAGVDGNDIEKEIGPPVRNDPGPNDNSRAVLSEVFQKYEKGALLKNAKQRDRLVKKIENTRERIAQENIEWKKKYLQRLETQLKKKLLKLCGEMGLIETDN